MRAIRLGICGVTLALASGAAVAADSSVTLYGIADTYIQYLGNGGAHSFSERSGGSSTSIFGLAGTEDLGGGLHARFVLENGFNLNNGSLYLDSTAMFVRQSWVGLQDDRYGTLTFGRQYGPGFYLVYPVDPFGLNDATSLYSANMAAIDRGTLATQYDAGRADNSILYQSPILGGWKLRVMYAFASTVTQPLRKTSGNEFGATLTYSGHGLYAGIGYGNQRSGTLSFPGLPAALDVPSAQFFGTALAYRWGIVNLQFSYTYNRPDNVSPGSLTALFGAAHPYSVAQVGATISATVSDTIEIAVVERNVRGAHDNAIGAQIGIDHSLSKRTSVYARAGWIKNNGSSTVSWSGVSVSVPGATQVLAGVGITHRF
ncbi:porin [Burkholderia sp. AU30198]|uniref:porin n=1 Tax=Burkholderia sp. AU30198 TaxID=2879627 RepID=UPI001CF559F8|nr:porin [Burkholderia sp. AU30198]MCA8296750.1 porin [Burkholderia sp. AU30198]